VQIGAPINLGELKRLGDEGVLALIGDSTNAIRPGWSTSEGEVRQGLIDLFKEVDQGDHRGAIIVTCFATNIARLESIAIAARSIGRKVAIAGRSLFTARAVATVTG
jgi:ribonuclease J